MELGNPAASRRRKGPVSSRWQPPNGAGWGGREEGRLGGAAGVIVERGASPSL